MYPSVHLLFIVTGVLEKKLILPSSPPQGGYSAGIIVVRVRAEGTEPSSTSNDS